MWWRPYCCAVPVHVCLACSLLYMSALCNTSVPSAPTASGAHTIEFIVSHWQRQIIHGCCALLNLSFHPFTYQSTHWIQRLWSHHLMSDNTGTSAKSPGWWLTAAIYKQRVFCQQIPFGGYYCCFPLTFIVHSKCNTTQWIKDKKRDTAERVQALQVGISPN